MRVVVLLSIVVAAACGSAPRSDTSSPVDDIVLEVEPDAVAGGDSITLLLRNRSSGAVLYNLCTSELQRRDAGDWRAVPPNRVCTMELRTLTAGGTARFALELPRDLGAGGYRYRTTVEISGDGERRAVASDPFRPET